MDPKQIARIIGANKPIKKGYCFSVTIENRYSFYGFFIPFSDHKDLAKQNKWRFIPIDKYADYYWDRYRTGSANPDYSLVLEADKITNIEVIKQERLNDYYFPETKKTGKQNILPPDKRQEGSEMSSSV